MITNNQVIDAIKAVITQYKEGTHNGTYSTCPLCKLFKVKVGTSVDMSTIRCARCPNAAFGVPTITAIYPCVTRTRIYKALDWGFPYEGIENADKLIEFWNKVSAILPTGYDKFVLTEEIKDAILSIAETYKEQ